MANDPQAPSTIPPVFLDLSKAEVVNPDGIRPVYSNNAAVLTAPFDFRLLFTEIVMYGQSDKEPRVELRANVSMAPTQFKAFAQAIAQALAGFEKQFGEITWPPRNQ